MAPQQKLGLLTKWFSGSGSAADHSSCACWTAVIDTPGESRSQARKLEIEEHSTEEKNMLWTILVILLVLWAIGVIGHIGGGLIHLLLIVAAIALVFNLVSGRRGMA